MMQLNVRSVQILLLIGIAALVRSTEAAAAGTSRSVPSLKERMQHPLLRESLTDVATTTSPLAVDRQQLTKKLTTSTQKLWNKYKDDSMQFRHLETTTVVPDASPTADPIAASGRVCSPDGNGVVFPDDDFNMVLFDAQYEPFCNCLADDNTDETFASLPASSNAIEFIVALNAAFADIMATIEYDCINTCANCFQNGEYCGILQTSETSVLQGTEGNFTVEQYMKGEVTQASFERLLGESSFAITTCINYTKGETGQLCYGGNYNFSTTLSCFVQYNDVMCNSCTFPNDPLSYDLMNNDCFVANCTNIGANYTVDTCAGTGFNDMFRFFNVSENNVGKTTVTIGNCDDSEAPTPTLSPIIVGSLPAILSTVTPAAASSSAVSSTLVSLAVAAVSSMLIGTMLTT
jgi:hypothetical protein